MENLRLKSELRDAGETRDMLKAEYADLQCRYGELSEEYNVLNQSYHRLSSEYVFLNRTFHTLMQEFNRLSSDYDEVLTNYLNLSTAYALLDQKHVSLLQNYTALSERYEKVLVDYVNLTIAYKALNQTCCELLHNYVMLERKNTEHMTLLNEYQNKYQSLSTLYQSLQADYAQLKEKYDAFCSALYKPLLSKDKVVPKRDELRQWLAEDRTNEIRYTYPDFICGDYAVMLHIHAKMKGWDMGIVGVFGTLSDGGKFNHAFNAIICNEGLTYVEPQSDEIFVGPIGNRYYHPGFGEVQVRELIVIVSYDSA